MTTVLERPVRALLPTHNARPERQALEQAALERVVELLGEMIARAPAGVLRQALGARTDTLSLVELLATAVLATPLEDPWAQAIMRGARRKQSLLHEAGGALSVEQVGTMLGISRAAVDKRRREARLLGVVTPSGDYAFPAAQFAADGTVLPGLPDVLRAFRIADPWMQLEMLLARHKRLRGKTGFEALAAGDVESVHAIAASVGEQGL